MLAVIVQRWSLVDMAIAVVVIAALCALVFVALRQFGVAIPGWVMNVVWIIVVAFVVIFAIRLIASM